MGKAGRDVKIIIIFVVAAVIAAGIAAPFIYFKLYSPVGMSVTVNCPLIDGKENPVVDIPFNKLIQNLEEYDNQKVYVDGRMAYYPRENQFRLRSGFDYIALDFSACTTSEDWKKWSVFATVKGKMLIEKGEPKIIVDHLGENPRDWLVKYFIGSWIALGLIGLYWILKIFINTLSGKPILKQKNEQKKKNN